MLRVPIRSSISSSIQELFKTSHMDGPNQRFCGVCGSDQNATTEVSLVKPPELLIVHLERFTQVGPGNFIKNSLAVACDRSISLTEKTAEPCTVHNYCLFFCHRAFRDMREWTLYVLCAGAAFPPVVLL